MKIRIAIFFIIAFLILLVGCTSTTDVTNDVTPEIVAAVTDTLVQPTNTPPPPPPTVVIVEETEEDLLPDLMINFGSVSITGKEPFSCLDDSFQLGTKIWISNIGSLPVGPFEISLNGQIYTFEDQIIPGDNGEIWINQSYVDEIVLDPNNLIEEADESNNLFNELVPVPTPPPACTATPEPTPVAISG